MNIRAALFLILICAGCQSGKIPCPELKYAKIKESKVKGNRFVSSPSKLMASNKYVRDQETTKPTVNLDRMRSSHVSGKEMLEKYGTVEEWDCPSPSGKRKHSKVTKANIQKNEKKMREHLKQKHESDSLSLLPR